MRGEHRLDSLQARAPARLEALEDAGLQQAAELRLDRGLLAAELEGARPVAGHRERVDLVGDALEQARMGDVEVVAARAQRRLGEADGSAVREGGALVLALDEHAVAAHAHRVGQRIQHVRVEVLRVAAVGARRDEEVPDGVDPGAGEGPVVAREEHHEVVEVPQPVVDRRRRQQHDLLGRTAQQPLHRPIPAGVLVAQRVRLVDDDQAVGVLGVVEMTMPVTCLRHELLVGGELLEGDDLRRQLGLVDPLTPALGELRGGDDEREDAVLLGALLDEREPDLRLAGPDPIRVDNPAVAAGDDAGALVAVALEGSELQPGRAARAQRIVRLRTVQLKQSAQIHGHRIDLAGIGEQQLAQLLLERRRLPPELVEPRDRVARDRHVVVGEAKLQVALHAGAGQVRRGDQRHARVRVIAEQVCLAVQELTHVAAHLDLGASEPGLHRGEPACGARGREAGEVALVAEALELEGEAVYRRKLSTQARVRGGPEQQAGRAAVGERGQTMKAVEVHVAGGDREPVPDVEVCHQVRERLAVARVVAAVVEQIGSRVHDRQPMPRSAGAPLRGRRAGPRPGEVVEHELELGGGEPPRPRHQRVDLGAKPRALLVAEPLDLDVGGRREVGEAVVRAGEPPGGGSEGGERVVVQIGES